MLKLPIKWIILPIGIGISLIPAFLICSFFIILLAVEPYITYKLTPTIYPNSQLVNTESGGGSGGEWSKEIYQTTDDVDKVVNYFEQDLPGFRQIESQFKLTPTYFNSIEYNGWVNTFAMYEYSGGVTIYPDPNDYSTTLIEVGVGYTDH